MVEPVLGRKYTRQQVRSMLGGGSLREFLPNRDGRVLGVCLDPEINLVAPFEVDVGPGPQRVRAAELAAASRARLPVFLKRSPRSWQYIGHFRVRAFSRSRAAVREAKRRRPGAIGILYLEPSPGRSGAA